MITKFTPWQHQLDAYNAARGRPAFGLFMDMGTGKTKVAIDLIQNDASIRKVLVLAPKAAVSDVWPSQFGIHWAAPSGFSLVPLAGVSIAKRTKIADAATTAQPAPSRLVFVTNYEAIWRKPLADWALEQEWDLIIADECHRIKAPGGTMSKFMSRLRDRARIRLGLSGTPMAHSPLDVYALYRFLDPSIFGTRFDKFRDYYAIMGGFKGYQVLGFQNLDELKEKMYSIAFRVEDTVLDLPSRTNVYRYAEFETPAWRIYKELDKEFVAGVKDGFITAKNVLVKSLRLRQMTSGIAKVDDGPVESVSRAKSDLMEEIFEDMPQREPLVVFANFHEDLDRIAAAARNTGRTCSEVSGRKNELKDWKAGKTDVLIVQVQSGQEGLDFTRARYGIFYSLGLSLKDYLQAKKRIHRPGQTRPVIFIHLAVRGTIDSKVIRALRRRKNIIDSILEDYKQ